MHWASQALYSNLFMSSVGNFVTILLLLFCTACMQVVHALGFTGSLFDLFVNPTTLERVPTSSVVKTTTVAGKQVKGN